MARYIDAEEFMEELNDAQIEFDEHYKGLGKAKVMLSLQPTADVVEVKRGEWIDTVTGYACSICHTQEPTKRFLYCPNCGARMDGRSDT